MTVLDSSNGQTSIPGTDALPKLVDPPGAVRALGAQPIARDVAGGDLGPQIAGYRLLARFEASAVNAVYLGLKVDRLVHPRRAIVKFVPNVGDLYDRRSRMLFDEALALSALDHPNIVRILEVGENEFGAYLAIELVDGMDLRRLNQRLEQSSRRIGVDLALYIIIEVLRALDHAHHATGADGLSLAMVHRDVNPSNILLSKTGHVRLADFGMVKMKDRLQVPTAPGMVKGKFRFLAPEYISAQRVEPAVDVYGVGVTLFELLTGAPWSTERDAMKIMRRIVHDGLPIEALERVNVPPELVGIVSLATEREPSRRFKSAADMASALEAWLMQRGTYVSSSMLASYLQATLATTK